MGNNNLNESAIKFITSVLNGEVAEVREFTRQVSKLPQFSETSPVATALHQVHHYVDDADIRRRDPTYHEKQTAELSELLEALKRGLQA